MSADEETILVCMPVSDGDPHVHGCVKGTCTECGQDVWVAPSGHSIMFRTHGRPVCVPCAGPLMEREGHEPMGIQPEQWEELVE